jgi:hypothetical protein
MLKTGAGQACLSILKLVFLTTDLSVCSMREGVEQGIPALPN